MFLPTTVIVDYIPFFGYVVFFLSYKILLMPHSLKVQQQAVPKAAGTGGGLKKDFRIQKGGRVYEQSIEG
jgi:hypothetical protein